jgi:hypothetical protein
VAAERYTPGSNANPGPLDSKEMAPAKEAGAKYLGNHNGAALASSTADVPIDLWPKCGFVARPHKEPKAPQVTQKLAPTVKWVTTKIPSPNLSIIPRGERRGLKPTRADFGN